MRIFNADGSEAEICVNGLRCLAKYVYESGTCKRELVIEVAGKPLTLPLTVEGSCVTKVCVPLEPRFTAEHIPFRGAAGQPVINHELSLAAGQVVTITALSVVTFLTQVDASLQH